MPDSGGRTPARHHRASTSWEPWLAADPAGDPSPPLWWLIARLDSVEKSGRRWIQVAPSSRSSSIPLGDPEDVVGLRGRPRRHWLTASSIPSSPPGSSRSSRADPPRTSLSCERVIATFRREHSARSALRATCRPACQVVLVAVAQWRPDPFNGWPSQIQRRRSRTRGGDPCHNKASISVESSRREQGGARGRQVRR